MIWLDLKGNQRDTIWHKNLVWVPYLPVALAPSDFGSYNLYDRHRVAIVSGSAPYYRKTKT